MSSPSILQATVRIKPDVEALRRDVKKAGNEIESEMKRSGQSAGRHAGTEIGKEIEKGSKAGASRAGRAINAELAGKLKRTGTMMTAGITAPIVAGLAVAVKASSDLNEAIDFSSKTFGTFQDQMARTAETASKTMGMSKREFFESAAAVGSFMKGMGATDKVAAEMSSTMVQLAADIGSAKNMASGDVMTSLMSGLAGEAEPMRRLGVDISAAAVEAEALSSGLVKANVNVNQVQSAQIRLRDATAAYAKAVAQYGESSTKASDAANKVALAEDAVNKAMGGGRPELDAQTKAMAAYQIIMRDTTLMQGNFGDTLEESLANQAKASRAELEDLSAEVGDELRPALIEVLKHVRDLIGWFKGLDDGTKKVIVGLGLLAAAAGPITTLIGTVMQLVVGYRLKAAAAAQATAATNLLAASNMRVAATNQAAAASSRFGGMGAMARFGVGAAGAVGAGWGAWDMANNGVNAGNALGTIGGGAALGWSLGGPAGAAIGAAAGAGWTAGTWLQQRSGMADGGTVAHGGLVQVGERGREVLALPAGAQVSPNGGLTDLAARLDTIAGLLADGRAGGMNVEVINAAGMDERRLARELDALSRRAAATRTTTRRATR